jgi:GT2 family glycosyltransferase
MKETAIIILNWNGWRDTCECITSIRSNGNNSYQIIIIDNGSDDNSLNHIHNYLSGKYNVLTGSENDAADFSEWSFQTITIKELERGEKFRKNDVLLVSSKENMGFSRACNRGLSYAIKNGFKYSFLLNNDTTLDKNCLHQLVMYMKNYPECSIISPIIYYYDCPQRIWSFGGKLTFTGRRLIYYENRDRHSLKSLTKEISFISGCALFAKTEVFNKYGLLSERFFFGEEDYEFSWRMKENCVKMCAISDAVVYHKVSISNKKLFSEDRLPYMFIGYLNRFIDRKNHTQSIFKYNIWRIICCLYIIPKLIVINRYPVLKIKMLFYHLIKFSSQYDCVDKNLFYKAKILFKI